MRPVAAGQGRHPHWQSLYQDDNWRRLPWFADALEPTIEQYLQEHPLTGTCLDLGCGDGTQAARMAERGFTVTGVDIAPGAIRAAQRFAEPQLTFICRDALTLRPAKPYDIVIDRGFLHVLPLHDRIRYVELLRAATRPSGLVLLNCFSSDEPDPGFGPERFSRPGVEQLLGRAFRVEEHFQFRWTGPLQARPLTHFFAIRRV